MQHYVVESNDDLLARLPVPFRVNCVLYKNYPVKDLVPYLERFHKIPGPLFSSALIIPPPRRRICMKKNTIKSSMTSKK